MPQDEGRKSRWRLVTTITKRSSHMPALTMIAMHQRIHGVERMRLNQRNCGVTMLQSISAQK